MCGGRQCSGHRTEGNSHSRMATVVQNAASSVSWHLIHWDANSASGMWGRQFLFRKHAYSRITRVSFALPLRVAQRDGGNRWPANRAPEGTAMDSPEVIGGVEGWLGLVPRVAGDLAKPLVKPRRRRRRRVEHMVGDEDDGVHDDARSAGRLAEGSASRRGRSCGRRR